MKHVTIWTAMLILVMGVAGPAEAQRSGFIMGFGIGPGVVSYTSTPSGGSSSARSTDTGLAVDFHIGVVVGDSFELYYMSKLIFFDSVVPILFGAATGMNGVGVTYPLNPDFSISGGIGVGLWADVETPFDSLDRFTGLGLVAGGGYQLSPRWALHLDLMYTDPGNNSLDYSVVGPQLTINIVSH